MVTGKDLATLLGVSPQAVSAATSRDGYCGEYDVADWAVSGPNGFVKGYEVPAHVLSELKAGDQVDQPPSPRGPLRAPLPLNGERPAPKTRYPAPINGTAAPPGVLLGAPQITVAAPAIPQIQLPHVTVEAPRITVEAPAFHLPAPVVNVQPAEVRVKVDLGPVTSRLEPIEKAVRENPTVDDGADDEGMGVIDFVLITSAAALTVWSLGAFWSRFKEWEAAKNQAPPPVYPPQLRSTIAQLPSPAPPTPVYPERVGNLIEFLTTQ